MLLREVHLGVIALGMKMGPGCVPRLQVDDAKAFIKNRVLEKIEAKEIPHQVGSRDRPVNYLCYVALRKLPCSILGPWAVICGEAGAQLSNMDGSCIHWRMQVEIVRFRTDTTSVGKVIVERAATLDAAAVVQLSACPPSATAANDNVLHSLRHPAKACPPIPCMCLLHACPLLPAPS